MKHKTTPQKLFLTTIDKASLKKTDQLVTIMENIWIKLLISLEVKLFMPTRNSTKVNNTFKFFSLH